MITYYLIIFSYFVLNKLIYILYCITLFKSFLMIGVTKNKELQFILVICAKKVIFFYKTIDYINFVTLI